MGASFYVYNCSDHPGCTAIVAEEDAGFVSSVSHLDASVPPEVRLNRMYPEARDHRKGRNGMLLRWRPPTPIELDAVMGKPEALEELRKAKP